MTLRDIKILVAIIKKKNSLGLPLDSSVNKEFEKKLRHKNLIFSSGVGLIHEFFNIERKTKNNVISKTVQIFAKNSLINNVFRKIADKGLI